MADGTTQIHLERIELGELWVPIEGTAPLVTHAWSEKALRMMQEAQGGKTRKKKEPKDPEAEYESAFYRLPDGTPGIPSAAFKSATVQGARNFEAITMTMLKQSLFVRGEGPDQLVALEGFGEPEMWTAPVRISGGTADLRYRPRFWPWKATLHVEYNDVQLSKDAVIALIDAGGLAGVGEWRPSAPKSYTGSYGTFRVAS